MLRLRRFIALLSFLLLVKIPINAEIQEVILKWNALLCLNTCEPLLRKQLESIPNIKNLRLNVRAGTAIMQWKPGYAFNYAPFNLATRSAGIRIEDFRLKVRGTIVYREDNFYIVSAGDGATFLLAGPIRVTPDRYIIQQNIESHPLSPNMRMTLLQAADNQEIVEIEGPLFEPLRYWLILIVEQFHLSKQNRPTNTTQAIEQYDLQ